MVDPAAHTLTPDAAASALRSVLDQHTTDLTIADAVARSGLSLRDAEFGLHRLLQVYGGHLSVTARGELLFRYPDGFERRTSRARALLRQLGAVGLGIGRWTGRTALTLFVLVYSAPLVVSATLVLSEFGGGPDVVKNVVRLYADVLYWSVHPLRAPDEFADEPSRRPRAFYERVNNLFLGPPHRHHDPRSRVRVLVAEVRARQGRIALGDVVRVTGLAPEPAGALVSRLLLDYDGHVDVSDEGAIVYRFPALRPSVDEPAIAPPAIWTRVRPLATLTGNAASGNLPIILLSGLAMAFGWIGIGNGWPIWMAEVPFYGVLALFAWILLRVPAHLLTRRADRVENARRALLRRIYEGAQVGSGLSQEALACVWFDETGHMPDPRSFQALLSELGGEVVIDDEGGWSWRFPTLELELAALPGVRASVDADEHEVGAVEFSSR